MTAPFAVYVFGACLMLAASILCVAFGVLFWRERPNVVMGVVATSVMLLCGAGCSAIVFAIVVEAFRQ